MKTVLLAIFNFFTNRIFLMSLMVIALFYILIARLFELQILQGDELAEAFNLKVIREVNTEGQRGNIYDRYGVPLAENIMAYNVMLNDSYEVADKNAMILELVNIIEKNGDEVNNKFPILLEGNEMVFDGNDIIIHQFKKSAFNHVKPADLTEEELAMTAGEVFLYLCNDLFKIDLEVYSSSEALDILNIRYAQYVKRYSKYQPETIAVNISKETLAELEEKKDHFPGISIVESPYRVYNNAHYFSHIIGYTRAIDAEKLEQMAPLGYDSEDHVGFVGLEKELETYLRGYDGLQKVEVNNLGKTMIVLEEVAPVMGNDVYLTIDHDLQIETYHILERQMAQILVDKLFMTYPKSDDQRYVLLKDVYDSIFRYELIDIDNIDGSGSEAGVRIYEQMKALKDELILSAMDEITKGLTAQDFHDNHPIYYYLFDQFEVKDYLNDRFYRSDYYNLFVEGKISFNQLMQALYEEGLFLVPLDEDEVIYAKLPPVTDEDEGKPLTTDFETDPVLISHVHRYIMDDFLTRDYLNKHMYLFALDQELFSYKDLTHLIVDVGLVTATQEQLESIDRNRLSPIDFMKEKILNIELTPKELVLDPSSGAVVISDVDTGEILALVSYPTYDNNRLVNSFDGDYYVEQLTDPSNPLLPRATMSKTVPGSTLKMLVGLAALEEGVIGTDEYVNAHGIFTKIWPSPKCWIYDNNGGTHGPLTVDSAIAVSCNYFFYEMGYRLGITEEGTYSSLQGISTLQDYIARVGLDASTGIEINEASASLPALDPVRASIGQEQNLYTPVQLARYMNVIADDGVVRELNLVDKVMDKTGSVIEDFTPKVLNERAFEQDYLEIIQDGMLQVTEGSRGTARSYFYDLPLSVAGKTGTAEIKSYDYKSMDPVPSVIKRANHAVFTGFAPAQNPEISVVSVIQYAYSSKYAALNSKEVIRNYFDLEREEETFFTEPHLD